jgi:hypothetical protein
MELKRVANYAFFCIKDFRNKIVTFIFYYEDFLHGKIFYGKKPFHARKCKVPAVITDLIPLLFVQRMSLQANNFEQI